MSDDTDTDTQFNCKLCSFVGTSKAEIAEHFLTEHIENYVSLSKATPSKPSKSESVVKKEKEARESTTASSQVQDEEESDDVEEEEDETTTGTKKSKTLDEIMQKKLEGEPGSGLGRGMRRRKIATPVKYSMDDDEEDEWLPKKEPEPAKSIYVKVPSILSKGKGKGRKKGKRGRPPGAINKKQKSKSAAKSKAPLPPQRPAPTKPEVKRKSSGGDLPVPMYVFNRILDDQVADWFKNYKQKRESLEMIRCPNDRCANVMGPEEFEVHEKCHVDNMDGFRCFECGNISLHWAKMRVHYRTEHNPKLNAAMCDFEGCSKTFPCIGTKLLQTHAVKAHFKPKLLQKLKSQNVDLSEYDKYMKAPETEREKESAPQKRGRKRASASDDDAADTPDSSEAKKKKGKKQKKFHRYKVFVCSVCFARFKDVEEMTEHKHEHYKDENSEVIHCTECTLFNTTEEAAMREHLSQEHKRMLHLHRCPECMHFSTNHYHDLKKHLVTHTGAKNYMCELCGRRTTTPFNLRIHYRRIHASEEEKKYSCVTCDYRCADKGILKEHIKHKHGLLLNKDSFGRPKPNPTFACPHCDYIGRKQKSLEYHMRIHKENRQFKCHLCPYASKTKNNLVLHVRTHEGLQPNKCPHCDFRGATNKIVSEHIMSKHAKVRPYRCNVCGWTASYNGNMWKHIENHQKLLGEQMPEFPVSVLTGIDDLSMPTALRAPSGKKRSMGKSTSPNSKPRKQSRAKVQEQPPSGVILANRQVVQEIPIVVSAQDLLPQQQPQILTQQLTHPQQQPTPQPHQQPQLTQPQHLPQAQQAIINTDGMVIQMINVEPAHDGQHIVKVSADGTPLRHHSIMDFTMPASSIAQQIIAASGEMTQVLVDQQHYQHQQHHHLHQQQQQQQQLVPTSISLVHPQPSHTPHSAPQLTVSSHVPQLTVSSHAPQLTMSSHAPQLTVSSHAPQLAVSSHAPQLTLSSHPSQLTVAHIPQLSLAQQPKPVQPVPLEIHAVAMHPSSQSNVPAPVVEQIVRGDTDHAVHHLVAAMMPRW